MWGEIKGGGGVYTVFLCQSIQVWQSVPAGVGIALTSTSQVKAGHLGTWKQEVLFVSNFVGQVLSTGPLRAGAGFETSELLCAFSRVHPLLYVCKTEFSLLFEPSVGAKC